MCGPFAVGSICQPLAVQNKRCQPHPVFALMPRLPNDSLPVSPLPRHLATVKKHPVQPPPNSDYFANLPTAAKLRLLSQPPHHRTSRPRWSRTRPRCLGFLVVVTRCRPHYPHPPRAGRRGLRRDWRQRGRCRGAFLTPMLAGHLRKRTLNLPGCLRNGRTMMKVFNTPMRRSRSRWRSPARSCTPPDGKISDGSVR
jgi:hypothetical protein